MNKYFLALDQGTTSSRSIVFDQKFNIVSVAQKEFKQHYPQPGWVEHDANEIWDAQLSTIHEALQKANIKASEITAIGITNQRETTVVWDKSTGQPIHPAIVWQDRRTAAYCGELKNRGLETHVKKETGLILDAYFSGTKLHWILNNVPVAKSRAEKGELLFGTIDSWLLWKLTAGQSHATDYSNASRTLLFNINTLKWDEKMMAELEIPLPMMPKVLPSAGHFGTTSVDVFGASVAITGIAGDQQAALFGQCCFDEGMAKNTYGTGCFMLMNTGSRKIDSANGLLTTIAWGLTEGKVEYALEGSVFIAGAAIQWLRDEMHLVENAKESEALALSVPDTGGVYVVPAFAGLGAPHWDMYARGAVFGLTRGTSKAHFVRAAVESLAYQTADVLRAMQQDSGNELASLRVDGGASSNNFLMQFQADMLDTEVDRPKILESTALGAAQLAAIGAGVLTKEELSAHYQIEKKFVPSMPFHQKENLLKGWARAVEKAKAWAED